MKKAHRLWKIREIIIFCFELQVACARTSLGKKGLVLKDKTGGGYKPVEGERNDKRDVKDFARTCK